MRKRDIKRWLKASTKAYERCKESGSEWGIKYWGDLVTYFEGKLNGK